MGSNTFAERLKEAMRDAGYTQMALAEATGLSQGAIQKLTSGRAKSTTKLLEISNALGVRPEWLVSAKGDKSESFGELLPGTNVAKNDAVYRVEVLDMTASAGPGTFLTSDFTEQVHAIEFSHEMARSLFGGRSDDIVKMITVGGDSMSPTIVPGDQIFVDVSVRNFETDGIYTFVFGQTFHVKRLQMQGRKLAVISDNSIYRDWFISAEDEDQFFIMGKVLIHQSIKYNRVG